MYKRICINVRMNVRINVRVCIYVCTYVRMYVCTYVCTYVRIYVEACDKEYVERRDKTCRDTFEILGKSGEGLSPLFDSRSVTIYNIYDTIYADAISLAIPACTNG